MICKFSAILSWPQLTNSSSASPARIQHLGYHYIRKWPRILLTHWGRDKIDAILQTFSNTISWMKIFEFRLKFYWSFFPISPNNNILALDQIMVWCRTGDKPFSEPMMNQFNDAHMRHSASKENLYSQMRQHYSKWLLSRFRWPIKI